MTNDDLRLEYEWQQAGGRTHFRLSAEQLARAREAHQKKMETNMTPTATTNTDRITATELRDLFAQLTAQIAALAADVADLDVALNLRAAAAAPAPVATAPAPAAPGDYVDFAAESLVLNYNDDGGPAYKIKGGRFSKFGVRVWPEVLPDLAVQPEALHPGTNPFTARVRAVMGDKGPTKVIGLAPAAAADKPF